MNQGSAIIITLLLRYSYFIFISSGPPSRHLGRSTVGYVEVRIVYLRLLANSYESREYPHPYNYPHPFLLLWPLHIHATALLLMCALRYLQRFNATNTRRFHYRDFHADSCHRKQRLPNPPRNRRQVRDARPKNPWNSKRGKKK